MEKKQAGAMQKEGIWRRNKGCEYGGEIKDANMAKECQREEG